MDLWFCIYKVTDKKIDNKILITSIPIYGLISQKL